MRLSTKATKSDAERAINLMEYSLIQTCGTDDGWDLGVLETGLNLSQRERMAWIAGVLTKHPEGYAERDLFNDASLAGIDRDKLDRSLEHLIEHQGKVIRTPKGVLF